MRTHEMSITRGPLFRHIPDTLSDTLSDTAGKQNAFANVRSSTVRFGFPKGSLQKSTEDLFRRAGFKVRDSGAPVVPA